MREREGGTQGERGGKGREGECWLLSGLFLSLVSDM